MKKFMLIGSGFIFPAHVEAIRSIGGKIREVVNTNLGYAHWKHAIQFSDADCVVILTPNDLHVAMAKEAIKEKKIVLCEKPLGLSSKDVETLPDNVFTVLQLRYHHEVVRLKKTILEYSEVNGGEPTRIDLDISVHRDKEYYDGWKGKTERSGGILFNLGIHYFDLIQYLMGEPEKTKMISLTNKKAEGTIEGDNYVCHFVLSTDEPARTQRRILKVNGQEIVLSVKDNLSYENLHRFIYQDLIKGIGIKPQEAVKSIKLIEDLCKGSSL